MDIVIETRQDPPVPPVDHSPFGSHFWFVGKGFSLLSLLWVPESSLKQLQIREVRGHRNKEKAVKQEK